MVQKRKISLAEALQSLAPGAEWAMSDDNYSGVEWFSSSIQKPEENDVFEELNRLQEEYDSLEYQRLRAAEYPDFKEYLDGVVKSDQAQIDAYIAACQAVKDKYPKPE